MVITAIDSEFSVPATEWEAQLVMTVLVGGRPAWKKVHGRVDADDFVDQTWRWLWKSADAIDRQGTDVGHLEAYYDLCGRERVIAWRALRELFQATIGKYTCTVANVEWYARCVKRESLIRQLEYLLRAGLNQSREVAETVRRLQLELAKLELAAVDEQHPTDVWSAMTELRKPEDAESSLVVRSGYSRLDEKMAGGFRGGAVTVVAARPGGGKSALAQNFARNIAVGGQRVLLVSLEMSSSDVFARVLSQQSGVPCTKIMHRRCDDDEQQRVLAAAMAIEQLRVHDKPLGSIVDLFALIEHHEPKMLMIDYLGLLPIDRKRDRREQVESNSNAIKEIALRYKIPVMLLAQLNRESSREGKEPQLHHLRETGAIEQDADNVMFLHQPQGTMGVAGEVKLIMRKQRNGEIGNVSLHWTPETLRFDTLDTRAGIVADEEADVF